MVFTKTDDNGESIRYALPTRIETREGSYISLFYNEDGILTRVSDSHGRSVTYGYEKREDEYFLIAATYPNGSTRRYTYNEAGLIQNVISPDGIVALTNEYDENRRVIHQIFPDGGEMSYSYDDEKNITTATEQSGLKVEYLSDDRGRHIGTRYVGLSAGYASQDVTDVKNIIEEKYTYNVRNQKTSITDKNGLTTRLSYDNRGNLTKIVGPEGLCESYTYDAEGRLIAKKDSEGNSYRYIYDLDGNLFCVTDPLGNRTKYDYQDGRVVRIRDAENNAVKIGYDEKGNISSITDRSGVTTRYICDNAGRVKKTIDAEGNETSYEVDESDNITSVTDPLGNTTSYTYNAADLLTEVINPDGTTRRWDYNEIGHLAFYTDESDHTTAIRYNTSWKEESITLPNGGMMHYDYDLLGNLVKVTDPMGRKTVYTHDNNGNVLTVGTEIDTEDNIENSGDTHAATIIKSTYTYDKLGRIKTETDGEGNTTSYAYDKNGNLICRTDALGADTHYEYDAVGRITKITDAIGREESYTYDKNGNIKTVTDPAGVVTENHFDKGRLIKVTQKAPTTDEATNVKEIVINEFEYDICGRICKQTERDGFTFSYEYDKAGRVNKVTGSNGRVMLYSYDPMGRVTETDDCGTITKYRYTGTGKLESVIDALGNETRYTYNDLDLLSSVERFEGTKDDEDKDIQSPSDSDNIGTEQDNAFPKIDGKGHVTIYEHDLSGKLISVTDALGQKDIYSYDESGELVSQIDRDGNETVYTRDKNGNIIGIKYADGNEVRYSYSAINLLKEVRDKIGLTKIESDIVGRTIAVTGPDGKKVGYEYGPYDEKTAILYPDGKRAEYRYDAFRNLVELKDTNAQEGISYEHDSIGRLIKRTFPGGASVAYDYYQGGLLKELTGTDRDGLLDKYEYAYNEKGNRTQIKRYRRDLKDVSGVYDYAYDELGRLSESRKDGAVQSKYSYDAFGNRKALVSDGVSATYSYDIIDRLISKKEESTANVSSGDLLPVITSYSYDNRGNLIEERQGDAISKIYRFDAAGKMVTAVSAKDGEAEYIYDALGHRVGVKENGRLIKELRDHTFTGDNILQRSFDDVTENYMFDGNICSVSRNNENIYMLNDELGSPVYLTGTDGKAFGAFSYDDFGKRNGNHYSKKDNILYPIAFTGYQEDRISGLCYAQARYYSPDNGRFISEDIVRGVPTMPDTVNHYLYCLNDPKVYVDKDGAFLHILAGAAAGALTGAVVAGVHSVLTEGHVDWAAVGGAAIGGAVTGAVVTACPAAAPAAVGALGGGTTSLATGILKGESAGQIAKDTVIGTVTGAIGGKLFQGIGATLGKGVSNAATKAFGQTAGKIVGESLTSGLGGGFINVGFSLVNHKMQGQSYGLSDAAKDFGVGMADGVAGYATHRASSLGFNKLATMAKQTNAGKTINNLAQKASVKLGNGYNKFANTKMGGLLTKNYVAATRSIGGAWKKVVEICHAESGTTMTPAKVAESWQGSELYPGVDNYKNIQLYDGDQIVILESDYEVANKCHSGYATTPETLANSGYDAKMLSEGLQIKPYLDEKAYVLPDNATYRNQATVYKVHGTLDVAYGKETLANPQYGKGGLPQYFVKDIESEIAVGKLTRGASYKLTNNEISSKDYYKMVNQARKEYAVEYGRVDKGGYNWMISQDAMKEDKQSK